MQNAMEGWAGFTHDMQRYYGVRMDCLDDAFRDEQKQYYQQTAAWADVSPQQLAGRAWCFKQYDLLKVTSQEIAATFKVGLPAWAVDYAHSCLSLAPPPPPKGRSMPFLAPCPPTRQLA